MYLFGNQINKRNYMYVSLQTDRRTDGRTDISLFFRDLKAFIL